MNYHRFQCRDVLLEFDNHFKLFSRGYGLEGRLGYNAGEVNPIPRRISGE